MIICTYNSEFYNYVIHHFMEKENLNNEEKIKKFLKQNANQLLVKEQFEKCIQTMKDLFYWTGNNAPFNLKAFHEVMLYDFLMYMSNKQNTIKNFNKLYFDETSLNMIEKLARKDKKEMPDMSLNDLKENYLNIYYYTESIYRDLDFLDIEIFCNEYTLGSENIMNRLGVYLDYYFEILPKDIRNKYKTGHCTLTGEINALIDYLENETKHKDLYKLFWNNQKHLKLPEIKIILHNIILFYFQKQEIDICWNYQETKETLKIIFYKKREENTKVLIELIDPSKIELNKDLVDKMFKISSQHKTAFFIFLTSNITENKKVNNFISKNIYTKQFTAYLNVSILDYHKRKAVSKQ